MTDQEIVAIWLVRHCEFYHEIPDDDVLCINPTSPLCMLWTVECHPLYIVLVFVVDKEVALICCRPGA